MENMPSSKLWTKSFITLSLCSFLLFLNLQLLLSSFPAYVKDKFAAGDVTVSLVTSVFALSAIGSRFFTAYLIKKIPRNAVLYSGLIIAITTTTVYVLANSIGSLLLLRVGYGIGFGMASTIIPTLVSQIIPPKRLGEGIGYFSLSTSLALSAGPIIGLNIMQHYNFEVLSIVGAVAAAVIFPLVWITRAIPKEAKRNFTMDTRGTLGENNTLAVATSTNSADKPSKNSQKFNYKLLFPAALNAILAITYSGLLSFIVLYGQSVQLEQVGLFFLFNVITVIIIRPISGKIFDRKGHGAVLVPAAICVIASLTVLSFATTTSMLIVSALLYGLGFGAIQPTVQAWMLRMSSREQHGMANSMFYNSTDFGVAAGALLLGAIASVSSYAQMYRYAAGFMIIFLLLYALFQRKFAAGNAVAAPAISKTSQQQQTVATKSGNT